MSEIRNIEEVFESELRPNLEELEPLRKKVAAFIALAIASILIGVAGALIAPSENVQIGAIVLGVIGVITFSVLAYSKFKIYRNDFKNNVVRKIVEAINPEFQYNPKAHVSTYTYEQSRMFLQRADRYSGDDYVTGKIEKTDFEFSEFKSEYKTETTQNGQRKTEWHTIFHGIFFHAEFNKHIEGETFIEPDTAERLFGKFGQKLQFSSKGKLVKLENPEFEKRFAVFSTNQTEARYILTPTMMEAMVNIQNKVGRKFHFSFIGNRVYCGVSFNKSLFEPRIMQSGVRLADVEFMYRIFSLIELLIHEMNLNTRIWTKE